MKTIVRTLGVYFAAGLAMQMGMDFAKRVHLDVEGKNKVHHIFSEEPQRLFYFFAEKERGN